MTYVMALLACYTSFGAELRSEGYCGSRGSYCKCRDLKSG
jgi:hypothetical protein